MDAVKVLEPMWATRKKARRSAPDESGAVAASLLEILGLPVGLVIYSIRAMSTPTQVASIPAARISDNPASSSQGCHKMKHGE
jgi:hypothetical protein